MIKRLILASALLACVATLSHAADTARKEPKTGKNCVIYFSSEQTTTGLLRMNFRNICDTPFKIEIMADQHTRQNSIEPGTPDKPTLGYVTCRQDDRCETAKWQYE
jgi:hypothetical protein